MEDIIENFLWSKETKLPFVRLLFRFSILSGSFPFFPSRGRGGTRGDVKKWKNGGGGIWIDRREQERRAGGKTGREIDLITRLPVSLDVFRGDRMQPRVDSRRGGERGSSWRRFLDPGLDYGRDVAEDAWFHLSVANQNRSAPWTAEMGMNYYRSNRWKSHQPCYNRPSIGPLDRRRTILWISFQSLYQSVKPERVTSYKSFAE